MKRLLALLVSCTCLQAKSVITDDFIDKVAVIESNFNYEAVGDGKKALGAWQMHESAWREACTYLAHRTNEREFWIDVSNRHKELAHQAEESRQVAVAYFKILEGQMLKNKYSVTPISLYMAYNMGFSGAGGYYFNHKHWQLSLKRKSILARANHILSR